MSLRQTKRWKPRHTVIADDHGEDQHTPHAMPEHGCHAAEAEGAFHTW